MGQQGLVLIKGCAGLGNRLLTLASGLAYAQRVNRQVVVDWRDGKYGAVGQDVFSAFFQLPAPLVGIGQLAKSSSSIYPSVWPAEHIDRPIYDLCKPCKNPLFSIPKKLLPRGRARMVNTHWRFTGEAASKETLGILAYLGSALQLRSFPYGSDLNEDIEEEIVVFSDYLPIVATAQLQKLPPLKESIESVIQKRMEDFRNLEPGSPLVGIHVRYTDLKPAQGLSNLVKQVKASVPASSAIFLATDAPEVQRYLQDNLPHSILKQEIAFSEDYERGLHRTLLVEGIERTRLLGEAITDMRLLSLCDVLLYQSNSSFSDIARAWHGQPQKQEAWDVSQFR